MYQSMIRLIEEPLEQLISAAVLQQDDKAGSSFKAVRRIDPGEAVFLLLGELTKVHQTLRLFAVDPPIVAQTFRQLFFFIGGSALNNLLLRKGIRGSSGAQLKSFIAHLETWVKDLHVGGEDIIATHWRESLLDKLQPITQAAHLILSLNAGRDVLEDVSRLNALQIMTIVHSLKTEGITAASRLPDLSKVLEKLRKDPEGQAKFLMDPAKCLGISVLFNPLHVKLEEIQVPGCLELKMLKKM